MVRGSRYEKKQNSVRFMEPQTEFCEIEQTVVASEPLLKRL